jgi:hypothetical protein
MSSEFKLLLLILVYAAMIFGLWHHAHKPEIIRQARRYLGINRRRCPKHVTGLRKGQLVLIDSSDCPTCKKEIS